MASTETQRRMSLWHGNCDPDTASTSGEDGRPDWYVPLDRWPDPVTGNEERLRGDVAHDALLREINLRSNSGKGSAQLFAGFRGTGKSTELARLADSLRGQGDYAVLQVQAEAWYHMVDAPSVEEMGLLLVGAIGHEATERFGVETLKRRSVWERMKEMLDGASVSPELKVGLIGAELQFVFKAHDGTFRRKLHGLLGDRPQDLKLFVHSIVEEVVAALAPLQLVVLVDGLEKFKAGPERIGAVYAEVADLFYAQAELLRLPRCHLVYTVPPYLEAAKPRVGEAYGGRVRLLPSVRVHGPQPERKPDEAGIRALAELLGRRVDLAALFGPLAGGCTRALIEASGGHVRDLFMLMRETILAGYEDPLPLSANRTQEAIATWRSGPASHPWPARTLELLQRIDADPLLAVLPDDDLSAFAVAMDQFLVLAYRNGVTWYDVHPLVRHRLNLRRPE